MEFKKVAQEHSMGCGMACVASILKIKYEDALELSNKKYAFRRGYYYKDLISALRKKGLRYKSAKVNTGNMKYMNKPGSIIFIKKSKKYPVGHYVLKTRRGWMNPWINYPKINPAKAGFQKKLPGKAQSILYGK
jgi:ABC-type bacteriocin/lantibiotic exporter with double-glycine peptidase domain